MTIKAPRPEFQALQQPAETPTLVSVAAELNPPPLTTAERLSAACKRLLAAQANFSKLEKVAIKANDALQEARNEVLAAKKDIAQSVDEEINPTAVASEAAPKPMKLFGNAEQTTLEYARRSPKTCFKVEDVCLATGMQMQTVRGALGVLKKKGQLINTGWGEYRFNG